MTSISGFDASYFNINTGAINGTGGFVGATGNFTLASDGPNLTLKYYAPWVNAVWNTATGNWTSASQWQRGIVPIDNLPVYFTGNGGTSTNNGLMSSVASLTFSSNASGSYTLDGSAVTIAGGITNNSSYQQTVAMGLTLGANQTFSAAAGNLTISGNIVTAGYTITANGNYGSAIAAAVSGNGALIKNGSGTLTLSGTNIYSGGTTVGAGTLVGTTSSLQGAISNNAVVTFDQPTNGTYAGVMSGRGNLIKAGVGTLTLNAIHSFVGSSASSSFTVASGATLGGNGTIGGATMIYGIHSPGNSPGIQTFTGNLTYDTSGGSIPTVNWQLSDNTDTDFSAFDQIVVGGNLAFNTATSLVLDFSGYGDVDWADPFWTTDQSWVIYDVAGTTTGANNFSIATANWADNSGDSFNTLLTGSAFSLGLQGNDLVLNYTAGTSAIPEPGQVAASLLLLSGIGIYLWRKKHAVQAKRRHS